MKALWRDSQSVQWYITKPNENQNDWINRCMLFWITCVLQYMLLFIYIPYYIINMPIMVIIYNCASRNGIKSTWNMSHRYVESQDKIYGPRDVSHCIKSFDYASSWRIYCWHWLQMVLLPQGGFLWMNQVKVLYLLDRSFLGHFICAL